MLEHEPDLTITPYFSLRVYGREFPTSENYWDRGWLKVEARVETQGATVEACGSFLRDCEIAGFCETLEQLDITVSGTARLACMEKNLDITLTGDALGHITAKIVLTPDHLTQSHTFTFTLDQTQLKPMIAACKKILMRYPIQKEEDHQD